MDLAQFRVVEPMAGLSLGRPVTVVAEVAEPIRGLVLPRAAVVRAPNGEQVVWRHLEPEIFAAAPVRIEPLDAARGRLNITPAAVYDSIPVEARDIPSPSEAAPMEMPLAA